MTASSWTQLFSGSAGEVIGLVGLFGVFWLTIRHERGREEARRAHEASETQRKELDEAIARLHLALAMQPRDYAFAPFANARALELFAACVRFAHLTAREHPQVAAWVIQEHQRIIALRTRVWRRAWVPVPGLRDRAAKEWGEELGELGGALTEWRAGRRNDDWFAQRLE